MYKRLTGLKSAKIKRLVDLVLQRPNAIRGGRGGKPIRRQIDNRIHVVPYALIVTNTSDTDRNVRSVLI